MPFCGLCKKKKSKKSKVGSSSSSSQGFAVRPVQYVAQSNGGFAHQSIGGSGHKQPTATYQQQPQQQQMKQQMNPEERARKEAMAQKAGALGGAAINHATGNKYKKRVDQGADFAVKKYMAKQDADWQQDARGRPYPPE